MGLNHQGAGRFAKLKCVNCGAEQNSREFAYKCEHCRDLGMLEYDYNYEILAEQIEKSDVLSSRFGTGMWSFRPLLPISSTTAAPEIAVGGTPLSTCTHLEHLFGVSSVLIKDDSRNPSGSLKDRASALAAVFARQNGFNTIATASTGNAAASLACLAATTDLDAIVYVPSDCPRQKRVAIQAYGAKVYEVNGTYDQAFERCVADAMENGWFVRNTAFNPLMTEGKKTVAYEICQQMNWTAPTAVFVGVGDGSIIGAIHKGFKDLVELGWARAMPRIFGVQAQSCNYLVTAWEAGEFADEPPEPGETIADSLKVGLPKDKSKALRAVTSTGGKFFQVDDEQILRAMSTYSKIGYLVEPASAAALAGLLKAHSEGILAPNDTVVLINTGTGLKDIASIEKMLAFQEQQGGRRTRRVV